MWVPPSHEHEAIDIGTSPTGGATFSAFIAQVKKGLEAFAGASGVKVWQAAKVCNGTQDGWYGEVLLKMGDHTVTEDLTLALGDKAYMATYARDEALPLDHSAHSALYTLCAAADSAGTSTGGNTPAAPTTPTPATDDHIAKADVHDPAARAHEWFNRMRVGDIDSTQLTATMNAALTKEIVKNVSGVLTALGTPTAFTPLQSMHRDGETAYAYMLRFPAAKIREVITINDKDNLIDGLFFQPAN